MDGTFEDSEGPPTGDELDPDGDMDAKYAREHFLGKNRSEAERLFASETPAYWEDLYYMGAVALHYYLPAAVEVLLRQESGAAEVELGFFVSAVEARIQDLRPVGRWVVKALEHGIYLCSAFKAEFHDPDEMLGRLERLRRAFAALED